ncbi:MAG: hypothetical protein HOV79_26690 [Hamadaea sp.]|nr:hypothetical protein [Hamadaea sp.]
MTDQKPTGLGWVPGACTLPTAEQPVRLAEFDALFSAAVRDGSRLTARHLRVTLAGDTEVASAVRDLADRETECCSFFTFTIGTPAPNTVQLDIEVPAGHVDVLDALEARAKQIRSTP